MVFKLGARLTLWLGDKVPAGASRREQRSPRSRRRVFAGAIGAMALVFSAAFIKDNALGYSEGLMTAIVLIAVERHLDGHHRQAFAVAFFAALDRPEIWLFWGPYGLWLLWTDPGARKLVIRAVRADPGPVVPPRAVGIRPSPARRQPRAESPLEQPGVREAARSAPSSTTRG